MKKIELQLDIAEYGTVQLVEKLVETYRTDTPEDLMPKEFEKEV